MLSAFEFSIDVQLLLWGHIASTSERSGPEEMFLDHERDWNSQQVDYKSLEAIGGKRLGAEAVDLRMGSWGIDPQRLHL